MTRPSHDPLAPGVARTPSGSFEGWVLYAPRNEWLVRLLEGWELPFIVEPDRSGYAVLLHMDEEFAADRDALMRSLDFSASEAAEVVRQVYADSAWRPE